MAICTAGRDSPATVLPKPADMTATPAPAPKTFSEHFLSAEPGKKLATWKNGAAGCCIGEQLVGAWVPERLAAATIVEAAGDLTAWLDTVVTISDCTISAGPAPEAGEEGLSGPTRRAASVWTVGSARESVRRSEPAATSTDMGQMGSMRPCRKTAIWKVPARKGCHATR